jgi:hypothetical protein
MEGLRMVDEEQLVGCGECVIATLNLSYCTVTWILCNDEKMLTVTINGSSRWRACVRQSRVSRPGHIKGAFR